MQKLRWYFKNETCFENYTALYSDDNFILVQNDNTKKYSFGVKRDFGTLYGFPVDQSCLSQEEAIETLNRFIEIDKSYIDSLENIARNNIKRWENMIKAITQ